MRKPLEKTINIETQYSVEVTSFLDEILYTMKSQYERTYSSPFALNLYSKESVTLDDGSQVRLYPRLKYAGAHLSSEKEQKLDVIYTTVYAFLTGLILSVIVCFILIFVLSRNQSIHFRQMSKHIWRGNTDVPWLTIIFTISFIIILITILFSLSEKYHVLGTDKVGQDVLFLSIKSIRTGLVIGTLTTLIMLPFAVVLGIMAGYYRGWIDDVIQYSYTVLSSIPGVLLIAAAILSIQVYIANHPELFETSTDRGDLRLLALCIILGITSWSSLCRLLRGETLKLRELDYVQAATAFGVKNSRILMRHILPNVLHIILIIVVLDFSGLVLAEAVLSYVGVGVDPSTISWGNMINGARLELAREPIVWWSLVAAFILMFTLVLSANLFADAVRDAFDPRMQGRIK
jgi:peptide/nickel transport system permease protein